MRKTLKHWLPKKNWRWDCGPGRINNGNWTRFKRY